MNHYTKEWLVQQNDKELAEKNHKKEGVKHKYRANLALRKKDSIKAVTSVDCSNSAKSLNNNALQ